MIRELITKNRSYRRYKEEEKISKQELEILIDAARISSCGNNMQALKYLPSNTKSGNEIIFSHLKWAAALSDWNGPTNGERPAAYIVILLDTSIKSNPLWDHGIAATNILLTATEMGYGGCMLASFNQQKLKESLNLEEHLEPIMVISLGIPAETIVLEEMKDNQFHYYRDEKGVHHVPKRHLHEILLEDYME